MWQLRCIRTTSRQSLLALITRPTNYKFNPLATYFGFGDPIFSQGQTFCDQWHYDGGGNIKMCN